jgi:phage terminase large subunit-like protein
MARHRKVHLHPAEQYAQDVIDGKIVACKWVRLACERHFHDLKHGHERGLYFDREAAELVLRFKGMLKHSKGKWAGENLILEPWQQFRTWCMYGWMREDGTRRFRSSYTEVARKNGKSTDGASDGLYLGFADGEPGAEVYSAATKRDQARIVHQEAIRMVRKNRTLKKYIKIFKDNLSLEDTASKYEPLGGDSDSMDGLNVHGAIVDELHAHKNRETLELLETATGAREQPMIIMITTAGENRKSVCFEKHEYTRKVLEGWKDGSYVDDTWFGLIYSLDDDDIKNERYFDEKLWVKANPNLGVSKSLEDLRMKAKRASQMAAALNNFLRRELNVWVTGTVKWTNMEKWREAGKADPIPALEKPEKLKKRSTFGGLDLSSVSDITAFIMVFPAPDEYIDIVCRFWIPEDTLEVVPNYRSTDDAKMVKQWVKEGYIEATPGNHIDHDFIYAQLEKDAGNFTIKQAAFDRWGASSVTQTLEKMGMKMVEFGQGYASMNPPMKELERLILSGKIRHGNHPVLTWMADNLIARLDPAGNMKPDKEKSRDKIDGMVALIMALDLALRNPVTNLDDILKENWGM